MKSVFTIGSQYWAKYISDLLNTHGITSECTPHRPLPLLGTIFKPGRSILVIGLGGDLTPKKFIIWAAVTLHWLLHGRVGSVTLYWIGGDVVAAKGGISPFLHRLWSIIGVRHIAGAPWFVDELCAANVSASPVLFPYDTSAAASLGREAVRKKDRTGVTCYLRPSTWESQYGARMMQLALMLPETRWTVVGMARDEVPEGQAVPTNVEFLGWVDNPLHILAANDVLIRLASHDAYSGMVRDAQAMGKRVLYNMPVQGAVDISAMDNEAIANLIQADHDLTEQNHRGLPLPHFDDQIRLLVNYLL